MQLGGIQGAIDHFHGQVTPNLLIVETRLNGQAALEELDRLAEVCDASTKVIVVGRVNDVELYRELMRRGASEYLVAPLNPMHLIEVISGLYLDPDASPIGRVVDFIGPARRAGSLHMAHRDGWCIAEELSINTTIVDLDLPFGTTGLDFNDDPGQGIVDALSSPERLDDTLLDRLLVKRGEHLSIFATPASLDRDYDMPAIAFEAVLDSVRHTTPCVIVDLPHVWTPWIKATLIAADEIVIVSTPDLASLRNTKNIVELIRQARPNDAPPKLVINQVGVAKRPEIPAKDFAETVGLEPALVMAFDPAVFGQAANNGQMLNEVSPKTPTAEGIRRLAEVLTGRAPQVVQKVSPFMSFLTGKKKA